MAWVDLKGHCFDTHGRISLKPVRQVKATSRALDVVLCIGVSFDVYLAKDAA